jgi:cytochrome c
MKRRILGCLVVLAMTGGNAAVADMVGHGGMVRALALSADGSRVLTGGFDYTVRLWNFVEQKQTALLDEHFGPVNAVAFVPGAQNAPDAPGAPNTAGVPGADRAISSGDDGNVIVWDLKTRAPLRRFTRHGGKVMAVAASPNGRVAASGGWDRRVRLWDIATGKQLQELVHPSNVTAIAFTPDGKRLVSGTTDGVVRVWRVADGVRLSELRGHGWVVAQLAVSPDGRRAISASTDATLRLWDLENYRELAILKGHDGPIFGVAFSRDGTRALSGGRDGAIIYWDLATRAPIRVIRAHKRPVWAVALTPDGRFGLSAGYDGSVRVWHLATGDRIGLPGEGDNEPKPWLDSNHPGAKLYRKCAACHSLSADGPRRSGPHFARLFGRRAGGVPGYKYSSALRRSNIVWTRQTLMGLFMDGPDKYIPGTKMPMQRVRNPAELASLVDYLRELTEPK